MAYTDDEIQTAVENLITSTIRRPTDTLGVRRTDITFGDVQEATAGVFILYPLAPFYVVLLGSKRLLEEVQTEAALVADLRAMVAAVGRKVLPMTSIETLFNAKTALQQLQGAVSNTAPSDITKLPAFQRFAANVQNFLTTEGSKVKSDGDIVPTPQEARDQIPSLMTQLTAAHADLIASVQNISHSIDDYNSVNLPSLVAQGVVSKATQVLSDHADALNALSPEDRLTNIRGVVLDLLAAKSVVTKFGSASGPTTFISLSGTGQPYSDATHPASSAVKISDLPSPIAIYSGVDSLEVTIDGSSTSDVITLNPSLIATMNGLKAEVVEAGGSGFIIGDGTNPILPNYPPPNNNEIRFIVTDKTGATTPIVVPLTVSTLSGPNAVPRTAQQICDDINASFTTAAVNTQWLAEPYFFPANFMGTLTISGSTGSTATFSIPPQTGADLSFVKVGNLAVITEGLNAALWTVNTVSSSSFTATRSSGVAVDEALRSITVGGALRAIRIRAILPASQIIAEAQLNYNAVNDKDKNAANTLGFNIFSQTFCRPSTAQSVADDINVKLPKKLLCNAVVDGDVMSFRTEPGTYLKVVSSKVQILGNVTYTAGSPNNTVDVVVPGGGLIAAGVGLGDVLVLRGGVPGSTSWTLTSVTDTACQATSTETAISGTGVSLEFGTAPIISRWDAIDIPTGVLKGRLYVQGKGLSKLDILLFSGVNAMQDPSTNLPLTMQGTYGQERLVLGSRDTTTISKIQIGDSSSAAPSFFTIPTTPSFGTSPWFHLPMSNTGIDDGDQFETHATDYNTPSNVYAITSIAGQIMGISPEMPSNQSWVFDSQPPPFARIRNGVNLNFTDYKALLDVWLAQSINTDIYFRDLNRFLNPLLVNANPTSDQIGSALDQLDALLNLLITNTANPNQTLEDAIDIYSVDPVSAVDTLLQSLTEKGADRASDVILAGEFSNFFGMSVSDVSYASYMQSTMRAMVQNDLPVSSTNRTDATQSTLVASAPSPDYEYTLSDSDNVGTPDIPADYDSTPR